ncbi:hypothetical protein [Fusibacter sp. JL216-2]|uniref:hypothetical protein n=1 Tax=Fusibacter sp. JL216-2 TaxID=3071453 RepID=UPI003D340705
MYKIKAFKEMNAVLGILKGNLTVEELNAYGNDVVREIENKLMPQFTYLLDVSKYNHGSDGVSEGLIGKMEEIEYFLNKMGLDEIIVIGSNKSDKSNRDHESDIKKVFFSDLDAAISYMSQKA